MTETNDHATGAWHPDPHGRHELRWWDGQRWTEHVSDGGVTSTDAVDAAAPAGTTSAGPAPVQGAAPAGHILDLPVLVVSQKLKLIELTNEYSVFDQGGQQVGTVRQVGQSAMKKALRLVSSVDQFMTHTLEVTDASGAVVLVLTRPRKLVKSRLQVADGAGTPIGEIVQQNAIGKIRFSLEAGGQTIGSLNAENWRAWNFSIRDAQDQEVARITKTWEGLAKTLFTTADNYAVQIHRPLADPMRQLVVASALCVDTALKQDNRGFN
ncbi:phospholipid scramblase-related protein [Actinomarinicola tropica]|uniref:DUF2510 domain-containing protein n=1 Tax=Actinomarinicola tropica TaxID=2789776 RepID=A0A5Q2RNH0_9ACTN|nr:phospholipid scramblase-related protein [Actinomarinicola tropica]QGG96492.1 DUF2510 domain-containing protein [Actinomarinicola tropica]